MTTRFNSLLLILVFSLIHITDKASAQSVNTELLGVWGEGPVNALQILDDHSVLFNNGMYLKVADFSDPESPVITRQMQTKVSGINQIHYSNGFFYAANTNGSDRRNFYYKDEGDNTFQNFSGTVSGRNLRIYGDVGFSYFNREFYILNTSDPDDRVFWRRNLVMRIAHGMVINGYDVVGDVIYVSSSASNVHLIDISDPDNAEETIMSAPFEEGLGNIQVVGDRLYSALSNRRAGYYDISDLEAPALVASVGPFENFFTAGIHVSGDLFYVHATSSRVDGADELHIYDISDEENPELIETISPGFEIFDFGVDGNSIYIAAGQFGLLHYTLNDESAVLASTIGRTGNLSSFLQHGETAFVVTSDSSFFSVDISNYSSPATLARLHVESAGNLSFLNDETLVLTNGTGFELIDVSDPASPALLSTYESEEVEMNHVHAAIDGDNIFLFKTHGSRQTRIEVIDVSDPASPALVSIFRDQSFSSTPLFPFIYGDHLLAVDRAFGGNLERYNISDPENISFIGDRNIPSLRGQQIYRNYLAGISGGNILFYDLSELPVVEQAASVAVSRFLNGLVINGDTAITGILSSSGNLYSLDLSDLENAEPDAVFSFSTNWPDIIYVDGGSEIIGGNSDMAITGRISGPGFYIYSMIEPEPTSTDEIITGVLPSEIRLEANYPNPFNPSTNIRFYLPESADIRLSVYDVTGRLAAELVNGAFSAGEHSVAFDGSGLASGIYLYRLQTPAQTISRKMTILK